jgi:ketosteroid isomerase-like protein
VYKSIIKGRVRAILAAANKGDSSVMINALHPRFEYRFVGETPLGGTRTTRSAMQAWWKRLYTLFPGLQFEPQEIVVEGPPWNTSVMTYIKFKAKTPDLQGHLQDYENEFMQLLTIKWGKITRVLTLEDTQRFAASLPSLIAAGITEASAAPIV